MFINDIRKEFFDLLQNERILVVAGMDVDSVCAVKILQTLLQCDNIKYTLVPVRGVSDLILAFEEHTGKDSGVKYVVLINVGITMDLEDLVIQEDTPDDLVIFVADSHKPIDVCNAYNASQIRLLRTSVQGLENDEEIPKYETIFHDESEEDDRDDEEDDEERDDENGDYGNKRKKRFDESAILKRRERRLWEDKRAKILFEYQQFSSTGSSISILMYELAWKMSRDTNDLLWCAIVGHTEQKLLMKSEEDKYLIGTTTLRDHVSRLNVTSSATENGDASRAVGCMKLSFDKELNLNLYRHWSIYESLKHTVYTAKKFKIWTMKGNQKLSEFLAELGLPLSQCKQKFSTMDLGLRNEVQSMFEEKVEKYGLEDITYNSFTAAFGFRHKFCAADIVYAIIALLEYQQCSKGGEGSHAEGMTNPAEYNFLEALDSLSRDKTDKLESGIEKAKDKLKLIMQQVQNFLDRRSIVAQGPFLMAVIQEGTPDSKAFGNINCLALLAHATLRAHVTVTGGKKVQNLPLVVSAPLDSVKGTCLVLGVPPVTDRTRKNLLGKAFEQAAKRTNSGYLLDFFDASVIQLKTADRSKFFDGLASLLN